MPAYLDTCRDMLNSDQMPLIDLSFIVHYICVREDSICALQRHELISCYYKPTQAHIALDFRNVMWNYSNHLEGIAEHDSNWLLKQL